MVDTSTAARTDPAAIYADGYAAAYEQLYLEPWPAKHATNLRILAALLPPGQRARARWLDLCCGQAWHFAQFPEVGRRTGIDLSAAQLARARARNPSALFVQADVLEAALPACSADLVTCFWGAYCYLDDPARIERLLHNALHWVADGGALYIELLLPEALRSFNDCGFAGRTAFRVLARSDDYRRWAYEDCGGRHLMTSPPLDWFTARLEPHFERLSVEHDGGFMSHLVATGRRRRATDGR